MIFIELNKNAQRIGSMTQSQKGFSIFLFSKTFRLVNTQVDGVARIDFLTTNLESPDCVNFLTCLVKHPNGDKKAQLDQPGLEPGSRGKSFPSEPPIHYAIGSQTITRLKQVWTVGRPVMQPQHLPLQQYHHKKIIWRNWELPSSFLSASPRKF